MEVRLRLPGQDRLGASHPGPVDSCLALIALFGFELASVNLHSTFALRVCVTGGFDLASIQLYHMNS